MLRLLAGMAKPPTTPVDLAALRAATDRQMLPLWLPRLGVREVRDLTVAGAAGPLAARLYRPYRAGRGLVLFLHGGGFVHCGLRSHDGICCRLARHAGCTVVALAYRLAPEHRFPAAVEDAVAALDWLAANAVALGGDPDRLAIAGDSAGGNLATVAARLARERGGPALRFQLLYYPPTHGLLPTPSRTACAEGYFLTERLMRWYLGQYIDAEPDWHDPRFAPFLAEDLAGLPPALIVTAGFDPLRDDGAAYAVRLREAGVAATHRDYPRTIHGFVSFYPLIGQGRAALRLGGRALRAALG